MKGRTLKWRARFKIKNSNKKKKELSFFEEKGREVEGRKYKEVFLIFFDLFFLKKMQAEKLSQVVPVKR